MKLLNFVHKITISLKQKWNINKSPFVYVAMGDSTIEGVGASRPERHFTSLIFEFLKLKQKDVTYHNLGRAGWKVSNVIHDQLNPAIELKPNLIVLSVGANDVMQRRSLKKFDQEYKELLEKLSLTGALIVINNIPDLSLAPVIPKYIHPYCIIQVPRYNKIIEKYAKEYGCLLVDLYAQSRLYRGYAEFISSDGLHPSDAGYALWANTVITKLESYLKD